MSTSVAACRKVQNKSAKLNGKSTEQYKEYSNDFVRGRIMFCILIVLWVCWTIYLHASIQRVKTGVALQNNSVSFINRQFIYDVIEHLIVPRYDHLVVVIRGVVLKQELWERRSHAK